MRPPYAVGPRLAARMAAAGLREEDCEEHFARASGPGGQNVNKTSSAVRLVHRPSGLAVRAQSARSQLDNRLSARRRLADKLLAQQEAGRVAAAKALQKVRRQKARRHRRAQAKVLAAKHHQADKKARRRPPDGQD